MPLMDITLIYHVLHSQLRNTATRAMDDLHKRASLLHEAEQVEEMYRGTADRIAYLELVKCRQRAAAKFRETTEEFDAAIKSLRTARFNADADEIAEWKTAGLAEIDPAWGMAGRKAVAV